MIGEVRGTLATNGLAGISAPRISERCDESSSHPKLGYELIVELRAGDHDTSTSGFAVEYPGRETSGTLEVGLETHSCVDDSTAYCASDTPTAQDRQP